MNLLISFCNSTGAAPLVLGLLSPENGRFVWLNTQTAPFGGAVGLAKLDGVIAVVCQRPEIGLCFYEEQSFRLLSTVWLQSVLDPHSLLWLSKDRMLVVSTGSDQIVELTLAGTSVTAERVIWGRSENGAHHLNSVGMYDGRMLMSYCWRDRASYVAGTPDGKIIDSTGQIVVDGLLYPHSIQVAGGEVYFCYQPGFVRSLSGKQVSVGGWARGLGIVDETAWVGSSRYRPVHLDTKMSASQFEEYKYPVHLTQLRLSDLSVLGRISLSGLGFEMYDLLPVQTDLSVPWSVKTDPVLERVYELERTALGAAGG